MIVLLDAVRRFPQRPRRPSALHERFEIVLVLERVERRPEAVVRIGDELAPLDQATEGLFDQILVLTQEVEDLATEYEVAAVDPQVRFRHGLDALNEVTIGELDDVERVAVRANAEKAGRLPTSQDARDHVRQRCVGEGVAVGGEEDLVVLEVRARGPEPLTDACLQPGVDERDPPILDVAPKQLYPPVAEEHEVIRHRFVVVEEELLDDVRVVAEAENELSVPEMRVVPHDVPEDGPVSDRDHRLRDSGLGLLHPQALPAAEENDLHLTISTAGIGITKAPPHLRTYASCSRISSRRFHGRTKT